MRFLGSISPVHGNEYTINESSPSVPLGTMRFDEEGNIFQYIHAKTEALAMGQVVTPVAMAAWDSGILIDGALATTTVTKAHIDDITTAVVANYYEGCYIRQGEADGKGRLLQIHSHPAFAASGEADIELRTAIGEAFADDAPLLIYNPFWVELTDAATEKITGVCIGAISSGYYGWVQVRGLVTVAIGHGTSAAIVQNEPLVPITANPGSVQGMAGGDEADVMEAAASPLTALDAASADTTGYSAALMGMK